jgi:hypothetical protein
LEKSAPLAEQNDNSLRVALGICNFIGVLWLSMLSCYSLVYSNNSI